MSETQSDLREFERAAETATQRGRTDEARRLWQQVLQLEPKHPRAIGFMAQLELVQGRAAQARDMLEQAVQDSPHDAVLWLTLARAYRTAGTPDRRFYALNRALAADPYCYPAMLEKAAIVEQQGRKPIAAQLFSGALKISPPDAALPRELLELVRHGREVVSQNARELESYLRARVRPADGHEQLSARFEECLGIAIGARQAFVQQPSMLLVPWLPAIPFYDRSLFPWLTDLERATGEIRQEYLAALREAPDQFRPYVSHPDGEPVGQWAELNNSSRWNSLHLVRSGERFSEARDRCPQTVKAVESLPLIEIENFAPTILFSVLAPHTRLPPHSSVTNARLVIHLPLIVPERCGFRVGNITREWREGTAWVFDDTIEHEAWNDSDEYRVILMIDVWNPHLSDEERRLVPRLLNGMREYYLE